MAAYSVSFQVLVLTSRTYTGIQTQPVQHICAHSDAMDGDYVQ